MRCRFVKYKFSNIFAAQFIKNSNRIDNLYKHKYKHRIINKLKINLKNIIKY
jgi:hypothetical protein